jgi:hypothetical protein
VSAARPRISRSAAADVPIIVERGIPVPKRVGRKGRQSRIRMAVDDLKPGESFALGAVFAARLTDAAHACRQLYPERKFAVRRMVDGTARVWRLQ